MTPSVGKRIKKYRHLRKMTQEDLAGIVGVDYSHIGKVERGENGISLDLLQKIARALRVDVEDLLK